MMRLSCCCDRTQQSRTKRLVTIQRMLKWKVVPAEQQLGISRQPPAISTQVFYQLPRGRKISSRRLQKSTDNWHHNVVYLSNVASDSSFHLHAVAGDGNSMSDEQFV